MFDVWIDDINLTFVILLFSAFVILPLQLLLCFKVRPLWIRLIPTVLFCTISVISFILTMTITGWDVLFWLIILIYSLFASVVCALAWIICALINLGKAKQKQKKDFRRSRP